jgi:hypothetical protein
MMKQYLEDCVVGHKEHLRDVDYGRVLKWTR